MAARLLTSAVGLVIFFCILPAPVWVFNIAVMIITLGAVYELNNAVTKNVLLKIVGVLSSALVFGGVISGKTLQCVIAVFAVYLVLTVLMFGKEKIRNIYLLGFTTIIYTIFLSTLALLKSKYTAYAVLLPFLFAWVTDSGAYFAGRFLGKHKLAPKLSPKKTVEGAIGGVIACVIGSLIYAVVLKYAFEYSLFKSDDYINLAVASVAASVISQFGDLASSAIKRECEIKDYGNILPGHGGILDRFDSVVFVTPFVYYLFTLIK